MTQKRSCSPSEPQDADLGAKRRRVSDNGPVTTEERASASTETLEADDSAPLQEHEHHDQANEQEQGSVVLPEDDFDIPTTILGPGPGDAYAHIFTEEAQAEIDRAANMPLPDEDEDEDEDEGEGRVEPSSKLIPGSADELFAPQNQRLPDDPREPASGDAEEARAGEVDASEKAKDEEVDEEEFVDFGRDDDGSDEAIGLDAGDEADWDKVPLVQATGCAPPLVERTEEQERELERAAMLPLPDENDDE